MPASRLWHRTPMSDPNATDGLVARTSLESTTGYAQKIRAGHHGLTADEPTHAGGTDTGPSPYGLVLSGLGACTSITLRMYAERKGWDLGTIQLELRMFKDADAKERIERTVRLGNPALTAEQRAKLAEIAEKTPVTRTLRSGVPIATTFA
jgi:putative redox protein